MTRTAAFAVFLVAIVATVTPAFAQSESIAPRDIWPAVTAAADSGDIEGAEKKLTQMMDLGRTLGIRRYPLYAVSAISLARSAHSAGQPDLARWAAQTALRLDPMSPTVAFSHADLAREQARWGTVASSLLRGVTNSFGEYRTQTVTLANLAVILAIVISVVTVGFGLVLFIAHRRSAAHDLRELLGDRFSSGVNTVLAFALLFLPLFLWLGPLWLIFYWYVVFFVYASTRERIASIVLLVLFACVPLMLHWASYRTTGVNSPVLRAAVTSQTDSYYPEALRRIRELLEAMPEEGTLHLLTGNLEVLEGNENAALIHFKRASELNPKLAGAHLNAGNLRFLHNDFPAATREYEEAARLDPSMAIAYYNHSVAAGETYRFDEQGQKLALAKKHNRSYVERLLKTPPPQKIVRYQLPLDDAWALTNAISRKRAGRELFANFARLDLLGNLPNPVTIGAVLALIGAFLLARKSKATGHAGVCIKCGRTFCPKCKSSRESATYCTQCIHIYLKRDGVSIDTKRSKLEEVQEFQGDLVRTKKILATFLPGSAAALDGATVRGIVTLAMFTAFVAVAILIGRLAPISTPAITIRLVIQIVAIAAAVITWLIVSLPVYRQRAAA
ncbi:MAG: tetratricopeptide repeat protein [Thermoanaerobaculia bacterium]